MTPVDPIALRVARRHEAAVVLRDVPARPMRIEYSDVGASRLSSFGGCSSRSSACS
jgi:hypothetical protein